MTELCLGFDPGGIEHRFGAAVLDGDRLAASHVASVDEAMAWAIGACGGRAPSAAGIDTLLHWATSKGGWRPCDLWLRAKYPRVRGSVMSPNGLFGSMSIGGVALALRLRQVWPDIVLNETHPKVLLHALGAERYRPETSAAIIQWLMDRARCSGTIEGDDEFDAALSAWATREGLANGWGDIVGAGASLLFPAGAVLYLWPAVSDRA